MKACAYHLQADGGRLGMDAGELMDLCAEVTPPRGHPYTRAQARAARRRARQHTLETRTPRRAAPRRAVAVGLCRASPAPRGTTSARGRGAAAQPSGDTGGRGGEVDSDAQ